jgi:hypothetical protein
MNDKGYNKGSTKRLLGWIGLICLLLIIPIKVIRFVDEPAATTWLVGITPSVLGPAGLLFLILSGSGRFSRLTLPQATMFVAFIALGLEFVQLLPRPGILANVYYTFDWIDVFGSLFSVGIGYFVARLMIQSKPGDDKELQ